MRRALAQGFALALAAGLAGCSSYAGSARDFAPRTLEREPGWLAAHGVPLVRQRSETDCGAAAIAMVVSYWTRGDPAGIADELRPAPKNGIRAGRLRDLARRRGLAAFLIQGELADLERELAAGRPVLVGLAKRETRKTVLQHYEVVVAMHPKRRVVVTLDPDRGWRQNTVEGFVAEWSLTRRLSLVVSTR